MKLVFPYWSILIILMMGWFILLTEFWWSIPVCWKSKDCVFKGWDKKDYNWSALSKWGWLK